MAYVSAPPDTLNAIANSGASPADQLFQIQQANYAANQAYNQSPQANQKNLPGYFAGDGFVLSQTNALPPLENNETRGTPLVPGTGPYVSSATGSSAGGLTSGVPGYTGPGSGFATTAPQAAPSAPTMGSFAPPDPNNFTKDPSYQFALNQGVNALQNSAAARGTLLTGATAKGIQDYGQQSALQGYQQAYNNALQTYGTNTNTAQANFGNQNTTFGQNLAARGQSSQIGLAQNAQAQAAQAQSFNEGQTQYQNQVGAQQYNNSLALQANQTQYDRALQTGAPYNLASYALPGLPQTRTLASSAYA